MNATYDPPMDNYRCSVCGAERCKLWRQVVGAATAVDLLCAPCALRDQDARGHIDAHGRRVDELGEATMCIGDLVPAVPCEERVTFWNYTSIPAEGWSWWRALPTMSDKPTT